MSVDSQELVDLSQHHSSTCKVKVASTSSVTQGPLRFTREEVSRRCHTDACWIIIRDVVYDVTGFIYEHPGGEDMLLEHAGRDATLAFSEVGHSGDAKSVLAKYSIGQVTEVERPTKRRPQTSLATVR